MTAQEIIEIARKHKADADLSEANRLEKARIAREIKENERFEYLKSLLPTEIAEFAVKPIGFYDMASEVTIDLDGLKVNAWTTGLTNFRFAPTAANEDHIYSDWRTAVAVAAEIRELSLQGNQK